MKWKTIGILDVKLNNWDKVQVGLEQTVFRIMNKTIISLMDNGDCMHLLLDFSMNKDIHFIE